MPVFDTPITTDDNNLNKVLRGDLPVLLYLFNSREKADNALEDAVRKVAKKHAGDLLVTRIDVADNPHTLKRFDHPQTPAVITIEAGRGNTPKSVAEGARASDLRAHLKYLLGEGPAPEAKERKSKVAGSTNGSSPNSRPVHVSDTTFRKEVTRSKIPVLVDFWAPWCGPCHMVAPVLEQLAKEYAGKVKIAKVNIDENPRLQRQFQIQSIPTLAVFRDGDMIEGRAGALPKRQIEDMIKQALL